MSNHHVRPKRSDRFSGMLVPAVAVISVVLALIAVPFYQRYLKSRIDLSHRAVVGKVIVTRITVVGTLPQAYRSGIIQYRAEAHVTYDLNGVHHDAWVPASSVEADRAYLAFWLSLKKSRQALIYWNPRNPADIQAVLQELVPTIAATVGNLGNFRTRNNLQWERAVLAF